MHVCQNLTLIIYALWCQYLLLLFLSLLSPNSFCVTRNRKECHIWNFQLPAWQVYRDIEHAPAPTEGSRTAPFSRKKTDWVPRESCYWEGGTKQKILNISADVFLKSLVFLAQSSNLLFTKIYVWIVFLKTLDFKNCALDLCILTRNN